MKFTFTMIPNKWIFFVFCLMGIFLLYLTIPSYGQSEKAGLYDTASSKPSTPGTNLSVSTPVFNESFTQGATTSSSTTFPWTVSYEADVMPTQDGWSERVEGSSTAFVQNSVLYLSTPPYFGVARAFYRSWSATSSTGWTLEVRLRVVDEFRRSGYYQGIGLEMYTPEGVIWFEFEKDKVEFFGCCSGGPFFTVASHLMNTTDAFHTYRILGQGTKAFLYVDGDLALDVSNALQPFEGLNSIYFGDDNNGPESGTAYWDYLRYSVNGAFPPQETQEDFVTNFEVSPSTFDPFDPQQNVSISFDLLRDALVTIQIQAENGIQTRNLVSNLFVTKGNGKTFTWDGVAFDNEAGYNLLALEGNFKVILRATDASDPSIFDKDEGQVTVAYQCRF